MRGKVPAQVAADAFRAKLNKDWTWISDNVKQLMKLYIQVLQTRSGVSSARMSFPPPLFARLCKGLNWKCPQLLRVSLFSPAAGRVDRPV